MAGIEVSSPIQVCHKCGKGYRQKKGYFPVSYGLMYKGTGFLHICNDCVDGLYSEYLKSGMSSRDAVREMCRKLDLYWSQKLFDSIEPNTTERALMTKYISKTNVVRLAGKSFDDTIQEEKITSNIICGASYAEDHDIPQEIISFWGPGYTPQMYHELEDRRKYWMSRYPDGTQLDIGSEALIRQICSLEIDINRDRVAGKPTDKNVNTLNTLLGSAALKPTQKKDDSDTEFENTPMGVWIRRWENERPIPEADPELKDVDRIIRYIEVWFKGHLSKMLNIRNSYSKMYDDEIERLRVDNPEFEDDDDETLFGDIFGDRAGGDAE